MYNRTQYNKKHMLWKGGSIISVSLSQCEQALSLFLFFSFFIFYFFFWKFPAAKRNKINKFIFLFYFIFFLKYDIIAPVLLDSTKLCLNFKLDVEYAFPETLTVIWRKRATRTNFKSNHFPTTAINKAFLF